MMLLNIRHLKVAASDEAKTIVDDVNIRVSSGEIVALVGGSGSGKTTTGRAVLRLLDPALTVEAGQILWKGEDVLTFKDREMRDMRGGQVGMAFQDPLNALNPVLTIQDQIDEVLRAHTELGKKERRKRIKKVLQQAGIEDADRIMKSYPHQLSGGLRQRAMIAQVLAGEPMLMIADEPTSSIDVTLQAKIVDLFKRLRHQFHLSILLITHDLGLVRHLADRVYVISDGRIVESGKVSDVMDHPQHPYTSQLIDAILS